jgi:diguanylate cyclase (GGDEF)-like protein/PAS domain S-box-containing protein
VRLASGCSIQLKGGAISSASITPGQQPDPESARLRQTLLEYQAILDNASIGITFTRDRRFMHCNARFSEMFGWASDELLGKSTRLLYPSDAAFEELSRIATPVLGGGQRLDTELLMRRRDGSRFWCRMLGRAIDTSDPSKGSIFITEDITERKRADEAQRQLLLEYQAILENASLGVTFTRKHAFLHCNRRFSEMFGWSSAELMHQSTEILYPSPEAYRKFRRLARPVLSAGERLDLEIQMKKRDGSLFWCRMLAKAIDPADHGKGTVYMTEDITERKSTQEALQRASDELERRVEQRTSELAMANARLRAEIQERKLAEQQIRHMADHDPLTGLPNRRLLEDRIHQALEMARRNARLVAIQFIDLDRFKPINDTLGHRIGDLLLQMVATRLRRLLRGVDTVSRVGGDEFVVVLPDMPSAAAACETARKILNVLCEPYEIEGHELSVTASLGISMYPDDGENAETLLARADAAMYRTKQRVPGSFSLYSST